MTRTRARPLFVVALGALVLCLAVMAAWLIDGRLHHDAVLPNVVVAGKEVRGQHRAQVDAYVSQVAAGFATATVQVKTPGTGDAPRFEATIPELGVTVDKDGTVSDVMRAGRTGAVPARVWQWLRSFITPVRVPARVQVDRPALDKVVAARDSGRTPPVEPTLTVKNGHLDGVAGKNGRGIDPAQLASALAHQKPVAGTLVVTMDDSSIAPRFSEADADRLAGAGDKVADAGIQVAVGDTAATVPADELRGWLRAVPTDDGLRLGISSDADTSDAVLAGLAKLLPDVGVRPVDAGFAVSGGSVSITPAKTGTACCDTGAVRALDGAVAAAVAAAATEPGSRPAPVQLPLKTVQASRDEDAARKLGIVEQVSTFTTPHNAGEPRVTNIHRMADTVRGTVIPPGGTFSLNGIVGQRTKDKGYVEAPVISGDYTFDTDVGGGVSQFSTTMFNASFFAGLEIPEFAMHGLYISRYPYGREATLSWPSPDLKVRNNTPYGVLVWPTYTDSSITVTLYSTKYFAKVEQSGQTKKQITSIPPPPDKSTTTVPGTPTTEPPDAGPCIAVTTERTRTFLDGHTSVDSFSGLYAPAEGWSCR